MADGNRRNLKLTRRFQPWTVVFLVLLTILSVNPGISPAEELPAGLQLSGMQMRSVFQPVVRKAHQSTVEIWCQGKQAVLGVVIDDEGHILTKASELQSNPMCRFHDGTEVRGKLIAVDRLYDLALLHVDHDELVPIQWAEEDLSDVGRWVISSGIKEIPMAVGVSSVQSISIPKLGGKPRMGIVMDEAEERPKVLSIEPFSSASRSGLRSGDLILQISNAVVESRTNLVKAMGKYQPGDSLFVRVLRGQDYLNIQITLDSRGLNAFKRQNVQNRMGAKLSSRRAGFKSVLQHDTVMSSNDCGGPLLNIDGEVIGLNIARGGRTESYAIPVSILKIRIAELESGRLAFTLPDHRLPETEMVSHADPSSGMLVPEPPPLPEN